MNPFGNMGNMMEQFQKMQGRMQEIQKEMESRTVETSAGGGMVKVVANGRQRIVSIDIDPEVLKMNDRQVLQDLVLAGVNEALKNAQQMSAEEMKKKMASELGPLGSLMKMF